MNLRDGKLVDKYGSWIRVLVAFYDFIFIEANELCATHLNEALQNHEFKDGESLYENMIEKIKDKYSSEIEAWNAFLLNEEAV